MRLIFNELFLPDLNKIVTKSKPSDRELKILFDALNRDLENQAIRNGISFFNELPEPSEKAKDCWQDTLTNTISRIKNGKTFDNYEGFKRYVLRINRNVLLSEINKNTLTVDISDLKSDIDSALNTEIELDEFAEKLDLLKGLGIKCKKLLILLFFDDVEIKIVAKQLNAKPNTISQRLARCIDTIEKYNNRKDIKDLLQ